MTEAERSPFPGSEMPKKVLPWTVQREDVGAHAVEAVEHGDAEVVAGGDDVVNHDGGRGHG